ncbi:hypothetical protein A3C89_00245 [Candidatus Kaiserbacteria bacterium RIFCSPHIGHO2_02_FULL_50_50]|uniref:D-alanyl-D-alanine carboxypeptidase-like core domain-containing protein n=1 Tax=Candidatus Kaiserbacteria bacterium RIFCSPHIGHO2_02_FULL_50_50 TaxID=1798492 RepID=A0A1F6DDZ4_9BACT|nr:MAG: hypothetical protein A3C89_00245 [Candidatus Kaiserbacteria bacterium RIFCSPHIGHO2_02_FULL_50_50]OGG88695.1 MAG: hypothetical protein A3G62_02105 [Candidatus Kaiserbacteria bacterium RIFCSPLOWO2_12_FULL_50_10]
MHIKIRIPFTEILLDLGIILVTILAITSIALGMLYLEARNDIANLVTSLTTTESERARLERLEKDTAAKLTVEEQARLEAENAKRSAEEILAAEMERINETFDDLARVTDTVSDLEKLAKTDKELLMKYSKTYFLNEHYYPSSLTDIEDDYVWNGTEKQFLAPAYPYLRKLMEAAADDGIDLTIVSAFRSGIEQAALKNAYTVQYGSGANTFSADQGYSEHQLGTAVDFSTKAASGSLTTSFDTTEAFTWLAKNAYRYGFILSYPKNNTYYIYEPWHWRFVGRNLARDLHDEEKTFTDMEQRKINEYLIDLFD